MSEDELQKAITDGARQIAASVRAGEAAIAQAANDLIEIPVSRAEIDLLYEARINTMKAALEASAGDHLDRAKSVAYQVAHRLCQFLEPYASSALRLRIDADLTAILHRLGMDVVGRNPDTASTN